MKDRNLTMRTPELAKGPSIPRKHPARPNSNPRLLARESHKGTPPNARRAVRPRRVGRDCAICSRVNRTRIRHTSRHGSHLPTVRLHRKFTELLLPCYGINPDCARLRLFIQGEGGLLFRVRYDQEDSPVPGNFSERFLPTHRLPPAKRQRIAPTRVPAFKFLYEEEGRPLFGDASSQDAHRSVKHLRSPMFKARLFPEQPALTIIKAGRNLPGTSHRGYVIYSGYSRRALDQEFLESSTRAAGFMFPSETEPAAVCNG